LKKECRKTERAYHEHDKELQQKLRRQQALENLQYESDASLLKKYKSAFTEEERNTIENILYSRGYTKNKNDFFNRT